MESYIKFITQIPTSESIIMIFIIIFCTHSLFAIHCVRPIAVDWFVWIFAPNVVTIYLCDTCMSDSKRWMVTSSVENNSPTSINFIRKQSNLYIFWVLDRRPEYDSKMFMISYHSRFDVNRQTDWLITIAIISTEKHADETSFTYENGSKKKREKNKSINLYYHA